MIAGIPRNNSVRSQPAQQLLSVHSRHIDIVRIASTHSFFKPPRHHLLRSTLRVESGKPDYAAYE
jgi:hypothetical protein